MPQNSTLFSQFQLLQQTTEQESHFNVIALENMPHKLGRSQEGFPKFFVWTNSAWSSVQNIVLEILSVQYNASCQLIDLQGNSEDNVFAIITLRSPEVSLQSYFIDIFLMMLERLPKFPANRELAVEVENLITIFNALKNPPKKKIQGLWAELLVIEQSTQPETLINAWHSSPSAKYDFTLGRDKIEVKSTSSEERIHKFSFDQLHPSANSRLLIASTIVRESGPAADGLSVKDLYDRIRQRVTAIDSQLRMYTIIAETIGSDLPKLENVFFDYTTAVDYLEFYDYLTVPSIPDENIPPVVTDITFSSNLNGLVDVRSDESPFDMNSCALYRSLI